MTNELLIACALKGPFILVAACLLSVALRRASAAARHLVWVVAFAALLLLPVLSITVPRWTVTVPQSQIRLAIPSQAGTTATVASKPVRAELDWLLLVWLVGATFVLARFGVGTVRVRLITRRARPMSIAGVSSSVTVLMAERGAMPVAWRVLRPVILLPA